MNKKIILILSLFCFSVLFSADHEYKLYDDYWGEDGHSKFDVVLGTTPVNTYDDKIIVCEDDTTNLNNYISKTTTYRNMDILSFCNSLIGVNVQKGEGQHVCGSGYSDTSTLSQSELNKLKIGNILHINNVQRTKLIDTFVTETFYLGKNDEMNNYLINNGMALLSKFPSLGQTPVDINKARGKTGVGCVGNYKYVLEKMNIGFGPGGFYKTYEVIDEYSGELDGTGKNYKFDNVGIYRVKYEYSIDNCFTLFEEKYSTITYQHLFKDNIKTPTKRKTTRTIELIVESRQGPDYNVYGEGATCGISGTPVQLTKGETVNVVTFVKIINDYSVPVTVSEMNAVYIAGFLFTKDIEIGSITTNIELPLTIQPGSERTIRVTIPSKIKDSVTNPPENYNLRVTFDYSYSDHPQKCYLGKSSVGLCNELITVSVVDDPPILYTLNANVDYEENIIDREFIENEKKTVTIFGRVNLTTNNGETPPVITTQWIGGADVELVSLQIQGTNIDCLKTKGLKTTTAQLNVPPYSYTGNYRFNNVKLNDTCLKYDIIDSLVAEIKVDYTTDDGTALTTSSQGQIPVNTALGILTCDLNYKLTSSNYRPGEGEEEYLITITIENQYQDPGVIEYKCGNEEGEDWKTTTKDEFECAYEFDSVNPEDVIYIAQARVKDDIMEGREAVCNANIGLCLPYV